MSDALFIDRRVDAVRHQLDDTTWVDLVGGFVRAPAEATARLLRDVAWSQYEVLRYDRYVAEQRLGATLRADNDPLIRQTEMHLVATYRRPLEGAVGLLYRNGADFQGLHSDRAMRWLDDTLVAIVVLGARRPFVFRPRGSWVDAVAQRVRPGDDPADIVLHPGEGDLLVMGGRCQADWLHAVPACDVAEPRISLTWRWTSRGGRPIEGPDYFDGRQFSDQPRRAGYRRSRGRDRPEFP